MHLLLDTHAFLWFTLNDPQLTAAARALILDPANRLLLSPASYWEIAIKISTGKYKLPIGFDVFMHQQLALHNVAVLPIKVEHAAILTTLPYHHRDPFDRLIIAQAMVEGMSIVGADAIFDAYPITRLW